MKQQKYTLNEIQVSYRNRLSIKEHEKVISSKHAKEVLYHLWDKDTIALHESFKVLLQNNSNKFKGVYELSKGGITGALVDIRILMAIALKTLSTALIVAHNHPSGILCPSDADIKITKKIQRACKYFDIKLLDHIILSPSGEYYSFADQRIL